MAKPRAQIGIIMGSDSDFSVMEEAGKILDHFGVGYEMVVSSAHRSPARTRTYVTEAERRGIKILIAGAGGAAHLAGILAAETILPVIGVPVSATPLQGLDSLLSIVQMPGGTPVATMAIGKPGAKNAAILAMQMLALSAKPLAAKLRRYKKDEAEKVERKHRELFSKHGRNTQH